MCLCGQCQIIQAFHRSLLRRLAAPGSYQHQLTEYNSLTFAPSTTLLHNDSSTNKEITLTAKEIHFRFYNTTHRHRQRQHVLPIALRRLSSQFPATNGIIPSTSAETQSYGKKWLQRSWKYRHSRWRSWGWYSIDHVGFSRLDWIATGCTSGIGWCGSYWCGQRCVLPITNYIIID